MNTANSQGFTILLRAHILGITDRPQTVHSQIMQAQHLGARPALPIRSRAGGIMLSSGFMLTLVRAHKNSLTHSLTHALIMML